MNRETAVIVSGMETQADSIDATYNTELLEYKNVKPTAEGTIALTFRAGENNNGIATSTGLPVEERGLICKDFYVNEVIIEKAESTTTGLSTQEENLSSRLVAVDRKVVIRSSEGINQFQIMDLNGRLLLAQAVLFDGQSIDTGFLAPGVYLMQVLGVDGQVQGEKFVKR